MISLNSDPSCRKPPTSPRPQSASPKPSLYPSLIDCEPPTSIRHVQGSKRSNSVHEKCSKQRVRSASAGRSPRHDIQARYWALLFENLHRAVDEIYQTCETDQSEAECKEAVLMLENYAQEFRSLIAWFKLSKDLENTPPPNRPTSLAWEVRKSSPGKGFLRNAFLNYINSGSTTKVLLDMKAKSNLVMSTGIQTENPDMPLSFKASENNAVDKSNSCDERKKEQTCLTNNFFQENEPNGDTVTSISSSGSILEKDVVITEVTNSDQKLCVGSSEQSNCRAERNEDQLCLPVSDIPQKELPDNDIQVEDNDTTCNEKVERAIKEECVPTTSVLSDSVTVEDSKELNSLEKSINLPESAEVKETSVVSDEVFIESNIKQNSEVLKDTSVSSDEVFIESNIKQNSEVLKESAENMNVPPNTTFLPPSQPTSISNTNAVVTTMPIITATVSKNPTTVLSATGRSSISNTTTSSVGPTSKPASSTTRQPFASAVSSHSVKHTTLSMNRSTSSTQYVSRPPPNNLRSNYQAKNQPDVRKTYADKRGGFSNPPRRGVGYQPSGARSNIDRKPYSSLNKTQAANPPHLPGSSAKLTKDQQKTGSTSSISSTSSGQSWADKVKGVPSPDNKPTSAKAKNDEEDNEGWETVHRGRTRSRASPIKATTPNALSASLTNLKEEEPIRKPPLLRRVHTEVGTFSAKNPKVAANVEVNRKPFQNKLVPLEKTFQSRIVKKDVSINAKPSAVISKFRIQPNLKTESNIRERKVAGVKRPAEGLRKVIDSKRISEIKPLVDTNIKRLAQELKPKFEKQPPKQSVKSKETENKEEIIVTSESEIRTKDDFELSEKELFLHNLEKEEEFFINEEEKDLALLAKLNQKILEEDYAREKLLEEELARESASTNLDDFEEDTEEELNTFDDNLIDWEDYRRQQIEQIHQLGLSWGDQMDQLDLELRTPGRAPQMHEKLSSPFRKRSITETMKRHEEKLAKAQEQREKFLEEKAKKFKDSAKKAEEIRIWKEEQQEQIRLSMQIKLQKAEEKRKMQLQRIVRKAHDEEEKVNEIAFINTLEAQNKRHDILSKEKDHELRLTEIQEERQRKLEEKAAKEAAAEERRKILEAERQTKLLEMQEKRKLKDQKIEQQLQEKEKERQELANQKARDREQRISALNADHQKMVEELQKKIQQKQEDSARRHEENMEQIRQKAFELSIRRYSSNDDEAPRLVPYETKKLCTLCNVLIASEVYLLSHLRGKNHQEAVKDQHQGMEPSTEVLELYNIKHIVEAPVDQIDPTVALDKERQKSLKKRCKKIKQRLTTKGQEWEKQNSEKIPTSNSAFKQKFQKGIRDLQRHLSALSSSNWESNIVTSLERILGECERALEKGQRQDKLLFHQLGGTSALLQMLQQLLLKVGPTQTPQIIPEKTLVRAALVYRLACYSCPENCLNTLFSTKIITLLDLVMNRLKDLIPDNRSTLDESPGSGGCSLPVDPIAGALLGALATVLFRPHNGAPDTEPDFASRVQDIVGYSVSVGIVDKLSQYLGHVRGPLDSEPPQSAEFILNVVAFLTALAARLQGNKYDAVFELRKEDETQLLATLQVTELAGTVSVLYGMLLHGGAPSRGGSVPPPPMNPTSLALALATLRMLNRMALLDYHMVQNVLGTEGLSLQLRHIASYLLWYCSHWEHPQLLHEVILLVGYFSLLHADNQLVLQSGQCPSVLQQLCSLPFKYFSDPQLTTVLFPTLVSCCFESPSNRLILEQEMSPDLLANYIEACLLDIHQDSLSNRIERKGEEDLRMCLSTRFPKCKWTAAKHFFEARSAT